jgi:hypothetical protein
MRILVIALVVTVLAPLAGSLPAYAQPSAESPSALLERIKQSAPPAQAETPALENAADYGAYKIQEEISRRTLILALIGAGIVSLVIVLGFLKLIGTREAATMVNASGLVLVVYATVLVVMIAKAEQQLTAAIGILGAIAGYLFGTATRVGHGTPAEPSQKSGGMQP